MPGTVLTVASGKGGVGKTTTTVNLAVALWREGNAVALVDADLGMANLAAVLDLTPEVTLHDVLAGDATLEEATIEAKDGDLLVLPGERELSGFAGADPAALREVLSALAERCDYVVVDTGAGLSYEDVLPLGLADEVLLVTTPDPAAIGDTRKTMQLADLVDAPVRGVVVTRTYEDTDAEAVALEVGADLLGAVPEDPAVTKSTTRGDPLESHAPDAPATLAYRDLADAIVGGDAADTDASNGPADEHAGTAGVEPADAETDDADEVADGTETSGTEAEASADDEATDGAETASTDVVEDSEEPGEEADADAGEPPADDDDTGAIADQDSAGDADADGDAVDEGGDANGDAADADADAAAPDEPDDAEAADDAETDDEGTAASGGGRGGVFGWLGRLFS